MPIAPAIDVGDLGVIVCKVFQRHCVLKDQSSRITKAFQRAVNVADLYIGHAHILMDFCLQLRGRAAKRNSLLKILDC